MYRLTKLKWCCFHRKYHLSSVSNADQWLETRSSDGKPVFPRGLFVAGVKRADGHSSGSQQGDVCPCRQQANTGWEPANTPQTSCVTGYLALWAPLSRGVFSGRKSPSFQFDSFFSFLDPMCWVQQVSESRMGLGSGAWDTRSWI